MISRQSNTRVVALGAQIGRARVCTRSSGHIDKGLTSISSKLPYMQCSWLRSKDSKVRMFVMLFTIVKFWSSRPKNEPDHSFITFKSKSSSLVDSATKAFHRSRSLRSASGSLETETETRGSSLAELFSVISNELDTWYGRKQKMSAARVQIWLIVVKRWLSHISSINFYFWFDQMLKHWKRLTLAWNAKNKLLPDGNATMLTSVTTHL